MAAMTRGTALVANIAAVAALTGQADLAALEDDSELTVATLLIAASDAIYDQLKGDGIDPTDLDNAEVFERAVAWHFLATLSKLGMLSTGLPAPLDPYEWSDPYYRRVSAQLTTGDEARRPNEGLPVVANLHGRKGFFDGSPGTTGRYYDERPVRYP